MQVHTKLLCAAVAVVAVSAAWGQTSQWDSKTAFGAAQVLGRLAPLNPTALQLEKLASKAALIERARQEYDKALQSLYDRERSRADDFLKYAVSGLKYTQQQLQRLDEWKARLDQLAEQRENTIDEVIRSSVDILTKAQFDQIAIRPEDRQEAVELMGRIRGVSDEEWPRFSQMAVMEFMRGEMRMVRGEIEGLLSGGDRGRQRDQFRGMFEGARARAMERLEYYRKLPDNQVQGAIEQLARDRLGEEGMRERVESLLREILLPEGAQQAILTLQKAKAASGG
ncbi:MAG: hypothetical protein AMXMBFR61_06940 [Fimbriimonadales bacterium]